MEQSPHPILPTHPVDPVTVLTLYWVRRSLDQRPPSHGVVGRVPSRQGFGERHQNRETGWGDVRVGGKG